MILQALTQYYEALVKEGKLEGRGWSASKISYGLRIDENGGLVDVMPLLQERRVKQKNGKEKVSMVPQEIILPAPVKRTAGIASNFLWDNSAYILGLDGKGKPERALRCFDACKELHHRLLEDVDSPAAHALLAFFDKWDPAAAAQHPALQGRLDELASGANLVFRLEGSYVHMDPRIRQAWSAYYEKGDDEITGTCLVTGEVGPIVGVHPAIKGVQDAQSSGAALVSFNAPAFCSYGKSQSYNAPTSKYAAFAYTSALNYLLSDRRAEGKRAFKIGDTTVVCWARDADPAYQDAMSFSLMGDEKYSKQDLRDLMHAIKRGEKVSFNDSQLDPNMDFYVLGLAPNSARLSVRFFMHNSFGRFVENIQAHYDRLEIVKPSYDRLDPLPIWALLQETVNMNSRDKSPAPDMAGQVVRAVLNNTAYPAALLNGVQLRIRAEHRITRGRAAILKAYYIKRSEVTKREDPHIPKEVLQVSLNENATDLAYNLGRAFSVLEAIQTAANPGINTTITDKYFNSAAATPGAIFPVLINLAKKHLRKLKSSRPGAAVYYEKQLGDILPEDVKVFPARQDLTQQGSFQLGYYFQTQQRYQGNKNKEDK